MLFLYFIDHFPPFLFLAVLFLLVFGELFLDELLFLDERLFKLLIFKGNKLDKLSVLTKGFLFVM
jgi:hypothetical protein